MDVDRALLTKMEYDILEAPNGEEAIQIARSSDKPIDLVLLDIKLPDMGANEVYRHLIDAQPGVKVIVCSGYSIDGPAQELLDLGANGFIQKPFTFAALSAKLNEVLGSADPA